MMKFLLDWFDAVLCSFLQSVVCGAAAMVKKVEELQACRTHAFKGFYHV